MKKIQLLFMYRVCTVLIKLILMLYWDLLCKIISVSKEYWIFDSLSYKNWGWISENISWEVKGKLLWTNPHEKQKFEAERLRTRSTKNTLLCWCHSKNAWSILLLQKAWNSKICRYLTVLQKYTGWPKNSLPLLGVSGRKKVFAKQLNRHLFGFATKNLTISVHYFQRFHHQKKDICNSAVFSPNALLQISFVDIILRLPVDISLIENTISYHNQYFEGSSFIYCSNQL